MVTLGIFPIQINLVISNLEIKSTPNHPKSWIDHQSIQVLSVQMDLEFTGYLLAESQSSTTQRVQTCLQWIAQWAEQQTDLVPMG